MKTRGLKVVSLLILVCMVVMLAAACGSSNKVVVNQDGSFSFAEVSGAKYYVLEIYAQEDVTEGVVNEGAKSLAKQTVNTTTGTMKLNLPFGKYIPTVYAILEDKTTTEVVCGNVFALGGTLTTPDFVVQRDYGTAKVSITDKVFDEHYFLDEAVYSFTVEVYTTKDCSGTPVATETFGSDAAYIPPTNSDAPIWIRNRSVSIPLDNGTYYFRVKANGNAADNVNDSEYSAIKSVTVDGTSTDVKYVTYEFKLSTGEANAIGENRIEFGNGSRQKFAHMVLVTPGFVYSDQHNTITAEQILVEGDLYTLLTDDGTCLDMHLLGEEGATSGECYTTCARPMPVDKPDLRGEWKFIDADTIHIIIMDDFQYFSDPADEKTT